MKEEIKIKVHGGMTTLFFQPGWSTGPDDGDAWNGIGFRFCPDTKFEIGKISGGGVIGKTDALKLAAMIMEHYGVNFVLTP